MLNNTVMKTIDEIRQANLAKLVASSGGTGAFAQLIERSQSQVSQWLTGAKNSATGKPRVIGSASCRYIEEKLGKPSGWLDQENSFANASETTLDSADRSAHSLVLTRHADDEERSDFVQVAETRVSFSAGPGSVASYELIEDLEPATYRLSWFQKYQIDPKKVRRFRVSGDSMEPFLYDRDTILVNTAETNVIDNKLYAIRYGNELRVKYIIKKLNGGLTLRSANPAYKDEEVSPDDVQQHITIIGRVRDKSGTGGL